MPNARSSQACFGVNSCCWGHFHVFRPLDGTVFFLDGEINRVTFPLLVSVDIIEPSSTVIRTTCVPTLVNFSTVPGLQEQHRWMRPHLDELPQWPAQ